MDVDSLGSPQYLMPTWHVWLCVRMCMGVGVLLFDVKMPLNIKLQTINRNIVHVLMTQNELDVSSSGEEKPFQKNLEKGTERHLIKEIYIRFSSVW